jgi:hypothetical protein
MYEAMYGHDRYKEPNQMGGMGRNLHIAKIGQHHGK